MHERTLYQWPNLKPPCHTMLPCCSQNIHLVARWLSKLDKKLEQYSEGSHKDYRVFMSAEPAADRAGHIIPQGILESSIKITNEPPTGMLANLHAALDNFNQVQMCGCSHKHTHTHTHTLSNSGTELFRE